MGSPSIKKTVKSCLRAVGKGFAYSLGLLIKASTLGLRSGRHITRYSMHKHLSGVFETWKANSSGNRILCISGSRDLCMLLQLTDPEIVEVNFPENTMLRLPFKDGEFDWVMSGQVLEHVEGDPQDAIDESYRVLKPGGFAVHTTCFINPIHECPKDFWRFTPAALQFLCKKFSRIIDVGGWGNPYVWFAVALGLRFHPIPHAKWHPLNKLATMNVAKWPIVTWIVAQK